MYEMFMGPLTMSKPWNTQGIIGIHRFLEKVWSLSEKPLSDIDITGNLTDEKLVALRKSFAQTISKVTNDTNTLNFNTAISQMMIFVNDLSKMESIPRAMWSDFVKILSVYAPHIGEELWQKLGNDKTIAYEKWPAFNEEYLKDDEKTIVVMVNGKLRGKFQAPSGSADDVLIEMAKNDEGAKKFLEGKQIVKSVVVKDKLVNFVAK